MTCPVDVEQKTWSCELPAAALDVVFTAEDVAPIYRRRVDIVAGETARLETLVLRPGASIAGYVEVEDGDISPRAVVRLRPATRGPRGVPGLPAAKASVQEDGFFQVAGLLPGPYRLEVEQPGFAPVRVFPIDLFEGRETRLRESVVLRRPLDLEFRLSPPVDWLGEPWRARLERLSSQSASVEDEPVFQDQIPPSGRFVVEDQAQGRYALSVVDSLGNRFHSDPWLRLDRTTLWPLDVEIDVVWLDGSVALGETPVSGVLWFGGRHGEESVEVPVDAEGRFQTALPRDGIFRVEVEGLDPELRTQVEVDVEPDSRGRAEAEIELPDTHVHGRVVDGDDRPVEGVRVTAGSDVGSVTEVSEEDGGFDIRAMPPGFVTLSAREEGVDGVRSSRRTTVTLVEGQPAGFVLLRLEETRLLEGLVVGPRGPIPGAELTLRPTLPAFASGTRARAGVDGRFAVELPEPLERAQVIVIAPGHTLKAFDVAIGPEPLRLEVPAQGGTLEVGIAATNDELRHHGPRFQVFQNAVVLPLQPLYQWSTAQGGWVRGGDEQTMKVPQVAPGTYRICLVPSHGEGDFATLDERHDALMAAATCHEEFLAAGGTLVHRFELEGTAP